MNWYDLPTYYDVSFSYEMKEELIFLKEVFNHYCKGSKLRLLEPACGTGRLLFPLASNGFDCTGFDLNENALRYLKEKLSRNKIKANVLNKDMASFQLKGKKYDAAYCTVDTFRHLLTAKQANEHLINVSKSLKKDGIYILGLHLIPKQGVTDKTTRWTARRGGLKVKTTIQMLSLDEKERTETLQVTLVASTHKKRNKYISTYKLRSYKFNEFKRLLANTKAFELLDVYGYDYEFTKPITLDYTSDYGVFVLRKL